MISGLISAVVALLLFSAAEVESGDFIPDRKCAVFYSSTSFGGESFTLKDFDQSVNLKREYRHSLKGWRQTHSVQVSNDCTLVLCSNAYFQGSCHTLHSNEASLRKIMPAVGSANCTCKRECKCDNIRVPRTLNEKGIIARAYVNGSCDTCDAEFIWLYDGYDKIPENERNSVRGFAAPSECSIIVCPGVQCNGFLYMGKQPVFPWDYGVATTYRFFCEKKPEAPSFKNSDHPQFMELPWGAAAISAMFNSNNEGLSNHPGLKAAYKSSQSGRSANIAWVILLGHFSPYGFGFPQCKKGVRNKITDCRIQIASEELGINSELRVLSMGMGFNLIDEDRYLMAALEEYISTETAFRNTKPNAIVVIHNIEDEHYDRRGAIFQRPLLMLHSQRGLLLDENYSNVVYLFYRLDELPPSEQKDPQARIENFEKVADMWKMPKPFVAIVRSKTEATDRYVNGHRRMENGEYWPNNLEVSLLNICDKGGDPLGHALLKAHFLDHRTPHLSIQPTVVDVKGSKLAVYQNMSMKAPFEKDLGRGTGKGPTEEDLGKKTKRHREVFSVRSVQGDQAGATAKGGDEGPDLVCAGNAKELEQEIVMLRGEIEKEKKTRLEKIEEYKKKHCEKNKVPDCSKVHVTIQQGRSLLPKKDQKAKAATKKG